MSDETNRVVKLVIKIHLTNEDGPIPALVNGDLDDISFMAESMLSMLEWKDTWEQLFDDAKKVEKLLSVFKFLSDVEVIQVTEQGM